MPLEQPPENGRLNSMPEDQNEEKVWQERHYKPISRPSPQNGSGFSPDKLKIPKSLPDPEDEGAGSIQVSADKPVSISPAPNKPSPEGFPEPKSFPPAITPVTSGSNSPATNRKEVSYRPISAPPKSSNNSSPAPPSKKRGKGRRGRIVQGVNPGSFYKPPRKKESKLKAFLLYTGVSLLVVGIIATFFVITRLNSFVSGISVPRIDPSGILINNSNLSGRRNILLLGLDYRPNDTENGTRSDTMILVSVEPGSKTASLVSLPRDLWVEIPGHGSNRINSAYFFGDLQNPGKGGPPLAKTVVSNLLGVPVDNFVQIDFNGFKQIVNAIGGVNIDVKRPLVDNEYPTEDFGTRRIYIPAGLQHMDGETALVYARSRHGDSDLGRNQRQQAVLTAIREQGINLGIIGNNQLQTALQGAIKTDLQGGDILSLVQMGLGLNKENIHSFAIDVNLTRPGFIDGNDVLIPDKAGIKNLAAQMMNTVPITPTPIRETANLVILNGTFIQGLASHTQDFLKTRGYTINTVGQALDAGTYAHSLIRVYNGKQKTASELAALMGIPPDKVQFKIAGPPGVDIEIICGEDLKLPE